MSRIFCPGRQGSGTCDDVASVQVCRGVLIRALSDRSGVPKNRGSTSDEAVSLRCNRGTDGDSCTDRSEERQEALGRQFYVDNCRRRITLDLDQSMQHPHAYINLFSTVQNLIETIAPERRPAPPPRMNVRQTINYMTV